MKSAKDQKSGGMKFDGMEPSSTGRSSKFAGNHWSGHSNDGRTVNKGRGPTRGNDGTQPITSGKPVTKDGFRRAPDSATGSAQYRGVGGTTVKKPANPDSIRAKQTGGPDYGAVTKGRTPDVAGGRSNFNYGPKSQY